MRRILISTEEILDDLEIKIGDTIEIDGHSYKLIFNDDDCKFVFMDADGNTLLVKDIIDEIVTHIPVKEKVGDTKCRDYCCNECPLHILYCYQRLDDFDVNWSLYRVLDKMARKDGLKSDNPIYLAFRAELDKEVE